MANGALDVTGEKYGFLTAIEKTDKRIYKSCVWKFKCDCGTICERNLNSVRQITRGGGKPNCGCKQGLHKIKYKNIDMKTKENKELYVKWLRIKGYCNNPKNRSYYLYGAVGVKVCKEWENDFLRFRKDVLPTFKLGKRLKLINIFGNFEKSNVVWR